MSTSDLFTADYPHGTVKGYDGLDGNEGCRGSACPRRPLGPHLQAREAAVPQRLPVPEARRAGPRPGRDCRQARPHPHRRCPNARNETGTQAEGRRPRR